MIGRGLSHKGQAFTTMGASFSLPFPTRSQLKFQRSGPAHPGSFKRDYAAARRRINP
jgi:hypothetical protein